MTVNVDSEAFRAAPISIGDHRVGAGERMFVIAELSANHNGSLARALETINAAAEAGADAVKLQTYTPDSMTLDVDSREFRVPDGGPWGGRKLYDLYGEAQTPWEWHASLFAEARRRGLVIFSTPFDVAAVERLETLDPPAYKIASFELVDDVLLRTVAATHRPVLVSTGMASLEEIVHAMAVLESGGARGVLPLRCTSSYPAADAAMNLRSLRTLAAVTGRPVGLSDHSAGSVAAIVGLGFGAVVIEKHFTLSRADGGIDSHFSMEPAEFASMVADIRRAEAMAGGADLRACAAETGEKRFRRSLYAVADIAAGEPLSSSNVRAIRPGFGLSPKYMDIVVGRRAAVAILRGTALTWDHLASRA